MESSEEHSISKPPPPPHLSKECIGIWTGWYSKRDREIAREAAAKGIDIQLVVLFLSLKKQLRSEEAEIFFRGEVLYWVRELLERKQIFRVSHVLNNINVDPEKELIRVFYTTTKKDLRQYIGSHLKKLNKLDGNMKQLWHFLDLVLDNSLLILNHNLLEDSIECVDKQSIEWKSHTAAKLFLRTQDTLLLPFLTGNTLWQQFAYYNDTVSLKIWISVRYSELPEKHNVADDVLEIFKNFPITNDMIDQLYVSEVSASTRQITLNELCRFGIFSNRDVDSLLNILCRIDQLDSIEHIYKVMSMSSSNISENVFLNLLVEYCLKNNLFHVINICVKNLNIPEVVDKSNSIHLDLILNFRKLTNSFNDETVLCDNIFNVARFLCNNLIVYFNENPLILVSLLFFTKNINLLNVLNEKSLVILDEQLFECIPQLMKNFKVIEAMHKKLTIGEKCSLSYYNLLEKHMNIDVRHLYSFQFEDSLMPHFNSSNLVQSYGYSKQIDFLFYVQELRPSKATKLFMISEYKRNNNITEESVKVVQRKIFKLALRNFNSVETASSCIAFLEMIGINSSFLKVSIETAAILLESGQDVDFVIKLFMNIHNDAYSILKLLETAVISKIDFKNIIEASSFIDAMKSYDIVVKFSIFYKLQLPEMFLKCCAINNMWLPFLIFAQINNYPVEQIKLTAQSLKNPNLLEHINHSIVHDIQVDEKNILMRDRDLRTSFFSRIGVYKSIDSLNQSESMHSSITSQTSRGSDTSSVGSDFLEIDILNTKATLLQTLIRCHNSTDPPRALLQACQLYRNPLLAILATSYEPDSIITNWLTSLAVSSELYQTFTNFESVAFCAKSVTKLLNNCIKNRFPRVLLQSLQIFIPENPLYHFVDFLNCCIRLNFDKAVLTPKLDAFKNSLTKCRRYSVQTENDHELTYLNNRIWIETTSLQLLSSTIEYNIKSLYQQIRLLQVLCDVDISKYVSCPNVQSALNILKNIYESKCYIKFHIGLYFDSKTSRKAVVDCINKLLDNQLFEVAIKVAQIEHLPLDIILIKEWQYKYANWDNNRPNFWESANEQFSLHNITADCVVEFYLSYVNKTQNNFEKYQLLKLANDWAHKFDLSCKCEIEKKKWMAYIVLEDRYKTDDNTIFYEQKSSSNVTYKDMIEMLEHVTEFEEEITSNSLNLLQQVVNQALNEGYFWLALKLEKMFGCKSSDLNILKLCFSLAEGILNPYQLNTEQRLLLTTGTHFRTLSNRRPFLSSRLSNLSSASLTHANVSFVPTADVVDGTPVQDTLALLHILTEKLTVGREIAYKIFMTYRISLNIEIPYHVIVSNTDYMKMLKDAIEDDCMHKLDVIHDFIMVYKWSKGEIADFICEQIVYSASNYVQSKSDDFLMWNLKVDQEFHRILQLLQDNCSLLGYKIFAYASTLHKVQLSANLDFKISELALIIELLITAHDCFTADCNMEGISVILKKCQTVISHLLTLRSWKLIVRLLTGVARYTEMNYVFQILKENDQFEFLLRKGSRKDNGLKVALLEYLRKYCPDNRELYKIVALHFTLFSEVALLWEMEAQSVIRNLIAISKLEMQNNKLDPDTQPFVLFTNTDGTRVCLNKAIENYTHATEFHLQGEKLAKAMNSARQAELLALQMSLLKLLQNNGTTVCLLNLNQTQISALISTQLSFDQSQILVQAYNYQPDWAVVLYEQCILQNNNSYLHGFLKHMPLKDSLVHDISRKFLSANINSPDEINSMKNILNKLPSVHSKYRIASELGFTDLVEDLITKGQLAYLKDTVWKKGYKN